MWSYGAAAAGGSHGRRDVDGVFVLAPVKTVAPFWREDSGDKAAAKKRLACGITIDHHHQSTMAMGPWTMSPN